VNAGLCGKCRHARIIRSDRGSTFYRCERALTDPSFSKYPRLPVLVCRGFDPAAPPSAEKSEHATAATFRENASCSKSKKKARSLPGSVESRGRQRKKSNQAGSFCGAGLLNLRPIVNRPCLYCC